MPDLITHITISHLIRRPFDLLSSAQPLSSVHSLFYLGTLLPDLLTRPWYILFPVTRDWTVFFHTPFGMLITSGFLALLFSPSLRRSVFLHLICGAGLHFLLDSLQKQITGNNFWLFPFSYANYSLGLAWAEEFMYYIPLWIMLVVLLELWFWKRRSGKRNT